MWPATESGCGYPYGVRTGAQNPPFIESAKAKPVVIASNMKTRAAFVVRVIHTPSVRCPGRCSQSSCGTADKRLAASSPNMGIMGFGKPSTCFQVPGLVPWAQLPSE